jgi:iron complex outermembrane receptor protein
MQQTTVLKEWKMGPRILPFVFACFVALPLRAQEPGEVKLFEEDESEIRVKAATKTDIPLSKAPGSVTVITHQQIKESGARTIPEVVQLVAGLNIRWNPMVQTMDIRGFGSNPFTSRLLLMIDGVPFNAGDKGGFPQQPALDFFVLQNVKRVEIVRGPGSALYGENAFWGVLNIVTLSGEDLQGVEVELYAGERETGSVGATFGRKLGENGSVMVSAKYLESKFPMVFWAEEQDSKVNGTDLFLKAGYKGLQMSYYRHQDTVDGFREEIPEPGLPPGSAFFSAPQLEQTVDIFATNYNYTREGSFSVGGDFSYSRRFGMHCAGCHSPIEQPEFSEPANHGGQVIGDFRVGLHMVPGNDLLFGIEGRKVTTHDHADELGLGFGNPGEAPDFYSKQAFYFQDQLSFADDRLRVLGGFRYDGKSNLFDDKFSPRIAAVFDATDRLVLRGGWSTAFRFPNFSELYQDSWFIFAANDFFAAPLGVFSPNPGLEPEQIETIELGGEYRFNPNVSAKVDFFRSHLTDFIVLTYGLAPPPNPASVRFENHPDEANIWGTDVELRFRAGKSFRGFANYSFQTQDQVGELRDSVGNLMEMTYAPRNKFNVAGYVGPFSGLSGNLEVHWVDEYVGPSFYYLLQSNFTDPTVRPLPSYALVDFRLNYDIPIGWNGKDRPWRISFYGKNLLDEMPMQTLIGVDTRLVGREFFFGTTFQF